MDKNYLIQLTNNLYRLTLLFPKKEPLRYKMREIAVEILANLIYQRPDFFQMVRDPISGKLSETRSLSILEDLEVLEGFFEVAKNQNWVSPVELLRIQEEYNRIKAELKKIAKRSPEKREIEPVNVQHRQDGNWRQEKILAFLKENGRAQVKDLKEIFPGVSKRTLRRDFGFLLKQGMIERIGERNQTFYQLKS